jgi:hypothetical protein
VSPEIERCEGMSVHVYRVRGRRPVPRAHVRRGHHGAETVVRLPLLDVLVGPPLSPDEMSTLLNCLQRLLDAWEEING